MCAHFEIRKCIVQTLNQMAEIMRLHTYTSIYRLYVCMCLVLAMTINRAKPLPTKALRAHGACADIANVSEKYVRKKPIIFVYLCMCVLVDSILKDSHFYHGQ